MKKMGKWVVGLLGALAFTVMMSVCALAGQEEKMFVVHGYDADGQIVTGSPAIVAEDGGEVMAISGRQAISENIQGYLIVNKTDGKMYEVDFTETGFTDYDLMLFSFIDDMPPASQITAFASGTQGQVVELLYIAEDGITVKTSQVQLTEASAEEVGSILQVNSPEDVRYLLPAFLLDDNGNMVAILDEANEIVALATDESAFYGGSNGGGGTEGGGSTEEGTEEGTEPANPAAPTGASRENPNRDSNLDPGPDTKPWWNNGFLIGGLCGIAGGITAIVRLSRKKKKKDNGKSSDTPSVPSAPVSPAVDNFIPDIPDDIPAPSVPRQPEPQPVRPAPQPVPPAPQPVPLSPQSMPFPGYQTSGAAIIGTAGNMVNQVYTVTNSGLTFGRDASCFVRFPADAKGVSRMHCRLYLDGSGNLVLQDCNATYGTHVKRYGTTKPIRLEANSSVRLQRGDKFYLGSNNISFQVQ